MKSSSHLSSGRRPLSPKPYSVYRKTPWIYELRTPLPIQICRVIYMYIYTNGWWDMAVSTFYLSLLTKVPSFRLFHANLIYPLIQTLVAGTITVTPAIHMPGSGSIPSWPTYGGHALSRK